LLLQPLSFLKRLFKSLPQLSNRQDLNTPFTAAFSCLFLCFPNDGPAFSAAFLSLRILPIFHYILHISLSILSLFVYMYIFSERSIPLTPPSYSWLPLKMLRRSRSPTAILHALRAPAAEDVSVCSINVCKSY